MTYFLQDVANYLYRRNSGNIHNTLVVFPNRRARLFFNYFLSQLSTKPLWAPKYYTISDFIQELSGLRLADPLTLLFRLYKTIKEVTSFSENFDAFYYYCEIILSDFDGIDKYRVNASVLYRNLIDIKAIEDNLEYLEEYQIDTIRNFWNILRVSRESSEKEQFISVWEALDTVYSKYRDTLEKEGLAYEGMAYRKAVDRLLSNVEVIQSGKELVFAGFNALNHSEEILFDRFKTRGNALFFWDYDESYIGSELHEAGFFLSKYLRKYPQPEDFSAGAHTTYLSQKITTIAVPSPVSQAKIINKCLEISGSTVIDSPLKTALILADESLLLPVVNSLPDWTDQVNISMGYPIIDTPAYSFITSLIDLHKNKRKSKNKDSEYLYYHQDFFSVLNHSYLYDIHDTKTFQSFQQTCLRKNLIYINTNDLPVKNALLTQLFKPLDEPSLFSRYLREIFEKIAEQIRKKDEQSVTVKWQLEILFALHKVLMRFEVLVEESGIELSFSTILNLLRKILKNLSVPFSGEPLSGLQVLGILETRTLDFETIIILSVNEGKFPKTDHIPSFIPFALREGFGLPTLKHQDAIYGYYFYRLLHRSRNVILVYSTKSEGLQKGEPSRFIYQLKYERQVPPLHYNMGYMIGSQVRRGIRINKTSEVFDVLKKYQQPGSNSFLSPSALNTYIDCKLRFYFKYIREISEPDQIDEQIEADVFGRILHKAMAILYKPIVNQECTVETIETLRTNKDRVNRAIDQAFSEEYFMKEDAGKEDFHGRNMIIRKVIEKYIEGILSFDKRTVPHIIESIEENYCTSIKARGIPEEVRIGGFIDRFEIRGGTIQLIDYKTGNTEFRNIESLFTAEGGKRNGAVFQIFLYSWILSKIRSGSPIQPMLYYIRDIFQDDYSPEIVRPEQRNKHTIRNFLDYASEFEERLIQLISEIFDSKVPFKQTSDTEQCRHCPYDEICIRSTERSEGF